MQVFLLLLWVQALCSCVDAANKQPHILLVVADDYGWNDIGYHGSEIRTPNLDRLAGSGVKLENYYVQPVCTPTRSQLMSGRYQIHTGLQHGVIRPPVPNGLPLAERTLADSLASLGYRTHMVGKWHLGFYRRDYTPTARGFHSFFGYYCGAEDYFAHTRCEPDCGVDLHDNETPTDAYRGQYSTHLFAKKVQEVVKNHTRGEHSKKPLFVYLPFQAVHGPLEVPAQYTKQYTFIRDKNRRTYAGMVSALDEAVGNVTDTFKEAGLWEDTLLVFTTDNGGQIHAGGNNFPLRGWKASLWEGGIHGNGFVAMGGRVAAAHGVALGGVSRALVHVSDWLPTLVHVAGGAAESDGALDGVNVWNAISKGDPSPRKELLHNIDPLKKPVGKRHHKSKFDNRMRAAIRVGDYKLITGDPGNGSWIAPPRVDGKLYYTPLPGHNLHAQLLEHRGHNHPAQLLENPAKDDNTLRFHPLGGDESKHVQNIWLFNIKEDPNEHHDLSERMPEKVLELLDRLAYYNSTAVPCRFPKPDPRSDPKRHGGFWVPWE